ncbi:MAG: D-aminoacyl-tRNA deacylase [Thermodesulforhabdaceae bacterium]|jgi:D-tyrosyl-tRNA(Tyr) deacylase
MRAVVQRVKEAKVEVKGEMVGSIGKGLLVFLGVAQDDSEDDISYIVDKLLHVRIFEDDQGKMNRSVMDIGGAILVVSQFTLYGDCRKGRRPSFTNAAHPEHAERLYEECVKKLKEAGIPVATGKFREMMDVHLINDGPVTILLDSKRLF